MRGHARRCDLFGDVLVASWSHRRRLDRHPGARIVDVGVRLFDLDYCCRLYGEATGFDASLRKFWEATERKVDLTRADHRQLTLQWLRDWGCRTLRVEDTEMTLEVLEGWAGKWLDELHAVDTTLDDLGEDELEVAARAYDELATTYAAQREYNGKLIPVKFGATAAAKTLFAIRPNALLPWARASSQDACLPCVAVLGYAHLHMKGCW